MPAGAPCSRATARSSTIREVAARVAENQVESHHKRALQILRDVGREGMGRRDFTRRTQFMDHRQREGGAADPRGGRSDRRGTRQSNGHPAQWLKAL